MRMVTKLAPNVHHRLGYDTWWNESKEGYCMRSNWWANEIFTATNEIFPILPTISSQDVAHCSLTNAHKTRTPTKMEGPTTSVRMVISNN